MEVFHFRADEWRSGPVMSATSFFERWRGLRGAGPEATLLLRANSVHGVGMDRPFLAVGLSAEFRVIATRMIAPGRFARFPNCRWVLEIPANAEPPRSGQVLELIDG